MVDPGMAAPVMQTPGQIPDPVGDSRSMLMNYLMARNDTRETPNEQTMNLLGLIRAQQAPVTASSQPSTMGQPPYAGGPGAPQEPAKGPSETFNGSYPLGKKGNLIGSPYGGTHNLGNWQSDNAIDLSAPMGTPIIAVADGTIGNRFGSLGSGKGSRFAGLRMTLEGKGNSYYYAHLSRFAGGIKPGARVKRGQVIGYSGSANGVTHLHLGVEHGNPLDIFKLR